MPLLPPDSELGWTPYAWLIYLGIFFIVPILSHSGWRDWTITILATLVFLPLYFIGYWTRGRQCLYVISAIGALGAILAPFNAGAAVFFVYAAAFAANAGTTRVAASTLAVLLAIVGAETFLVHLPAFFWANAALFTLLIGSVNIHFFQQKEAHRCLRLAQSEVERLAKVAERERIARDMHDILGHTLSVVILKSELAGKLVESDPGRARAEIGDVERAAREALAEVRSAIGGYRAENLAAELERAQLTLRTAGVAPECRWFPPPLSPAQETVLALALREGVTNVVRHSHAAACRLSLAQVDGCCRLEILDDGRGGVTVEGHGLRGMRERVEALGGAVARDTTRGTRLVITLPIAAGPSPSLSA